LPFNFILANAANATQFSSFIIRGAPDGNASGVGPITDVIQTNANLFKRNVDGWDVDLIARPEVPLGRLTVRLSGTYLTKSDVQNADGTFTSNLDQELTATGGIVPRWHHVASATYDTGPWMVSWWRTTRRATTTSRATSPAARRATWAPTRRGTCRARTAGSRTGASRSARRTSSIAIRRTPTEAASSRRDTTSRTRTYAVASSTARCSTCFADPRARADYAAEDRGGNGALRRAAIERPSASARVRINPSAMPSSGFFTRAHDSSSLRCSVSSLARSAWKRAFSASSAMRVSSSGKTSCSSSW